MLWQWIDMPRPEAEDDERYVIKVSLPILPKNGTTHVNGVTIYCYGRGYFGLQRYQITQPNGENVTFDIVDQEKALVRVVCFTGQVDGSNIEISREMLGEIGSKRISAVLDYCFR